MCKRAVRCLGALHSCQLAHWYMQLTRSTQRAGAETVGCCRVTDSLMQHGRNNGKKMMAVRIIKHSFEIVHLLTDQNPIQVLVDAIINRCCHCPNSCDLCMYAGSSLLA